MRVSELKYDLPTGRIAQHPVEQRDRSRLLVVDRATREHRHARFDQLAELLPAGSLLVLNDTRVLPARLWMHRASGGRVEGLFLNELSPGVWEVMLTGSGRLKVGEWLTIDGSKRALRLLERIAAGTWRAEPSPAGEALTILAECGCTPLPPYIKRGEGETGRGGEWESGRAEEQAGGRTAPFSRDVASPFSRDVASPFSRDPKGSASGDAISSLPHGEDPGPARPPERPQHADPQSAIRNPQSQIVQDQLDRRRYQTVYARHPGAVAAPTAGLHFTPAAFDSLRAAGIGTTFVTLHVGVGTFAPIRCDDLSDHEMQAEWYDCPAETTSAVNAARGQGRPIVAVGTTSVRVLETCTNRSGHVAAGSGWTRLFIHPPYRFRVVDAMLTNFHLPGSTLLAMVFAFAGRERILAAYKDAIRRGYRFYSYGDAMLIL